jgi:hypothetical protein
MIAAPNASFSDLAEHCRGKAEPGDARGHVPRRAARLRREAQGSRRGDRHQVDDELAQRDDIVFHCRASCR